MPYTLKDLRRDAKREMKDEVLAEATPEELLKFIPDEKRLEGIPDEKRVEGVPMEKRLKGATADQVWDALSPEAKAELLLRLANVEKPKP